MACQTRRLTIACAPSTRQRSGSQSKITNPIRGFSSPVRKTNRQDQPAVLLSWLSHPARHEPVKAGLAILVTVAMAVSVTSWAGLWLGLVASAVLLASVSGFLFPTRYKVFEDHLAIETALGTQRRAWSSFRRADAGRRGVHLSPFSSRSWLDGTRGLYLRFGSNRDEVLAAVDSRLAANREERVSGTSRQAHAELEESRAG